MAVAYVQSVAVQLANTTPISTANFGSSVQQGSLIVVAVLGGYIFSPKNATSVTDTLGNTYTQATSAANGNLPRISLWYTISQSSGTNAITAAFNTNQGIGSIVAQEFTGVNQTNPLDRTAISNTTLTTANTSNTTYANELVVGVGAGTGSTIFTLGSGYSNLGEQHASGSLAMQSKLVSAIGAQSSTMGGGSGNFSSMVATFREAVQVVAPPQIASTTTLYAPLVSPDQTLVPPVISSASVLYAPTLTPGAVTLLLPHISSAEILYDPFVALDGLTVPHISSIEQLFPPALTTGPVELLLPYIDSAEILYPPLVSPDQDLLLSYIDEANQLFAPTIVPGAVTLLLPTIAHTNQLFEPTLIPGFVTLVTPFISSAEILYPPVIIGEPMLFLPFLDHSNQLFPPLLYMYISENVVPIGTSIKDAIRMAQTKQPVGEIAAKPDIPQMASVKDKVEMAQAPSARVTGAPDEDKPPRAFAAYDLSAMIKPDNDKPRIKH